MVSGSSGSLHRLKTAFHYYSSAVGNSTEDGDVLPLDLALLQPVSQQSVPASNLLPSAARHTGLVSLLNVTGESSSNRAMSLLLLSFENCGWTMDLRTCLRISLGVGF